MTPDPLRALRVIDRLEVGPPRLEKRRLRMPYRVVGAGGDADEKELTYRFEEDVFDPEEIDAQNLAAMIGAQVALNYGLFAKTIEFRGKFDAHDRRFLEDMARNTAREIYVKKILGPNPFLCGAAVGLEPVRLEHYLQAELVFPDDELPVRRKPARDRDRAAAEATSRRHAVLSSGGKDSLLSFGILDEIDCEVDAIFVNESGRHWFTALNAYRHFATDVPRTARVWTDSDRLFNWMLRHLPFVRSDFADVRSDMYPIRLWTVAVFLFGALPILRKRGIGRLVIGDEYDTTNPRSSHGIHHYDGVYDQSLYFDNAMSRYAGRKGWGFCQFSLLRPLSELLIQTILARRYPELLRQQVSCHAAHKEGDRIIPCGRCEKCRRIVALLSTIGIDPAQCGYSTEAVARCLDAFSEHGANLDRPSIQHVAKRLVDAGAIRADSPVGSTARERPEAEKLRFHPRRSPIEAIPADLRAPLYKLFLEHAGGALRKVGRNWLETDVLSDETLGRPYPYETAGGARASSGSARSEPMTGKESHLLATLTWPEAEVRLREVDVALLPVGAIEQHGYHLPLDTDAFDADYLAREVASACSDPKPLVLPLISYGVSYHHRDFPGTISVSPDTLSRMVYEIGMDIARQGVNKLFIINGHGGNGPTLHFAAQMINRDAHIFTCVDSGDTSDADIDAIATTQSDVHAGEIETSTSLSNRPGLVQMDRAEKCVPEFSNRYLDFSSKRGVGWYAYTSRISQSGVMGDPTVATAEKGDRMWEVMIRNLVEFVEDLKSMSLDELHQKRY